MYCLSSSYGISHSMPKHILRKSSGEYFSSSDWTQRVKDLEIFVHLDNISPRSSSVLFSGGIRRKLLYIEKTLFQRKQDEQIVEDGFGPSILIYSHSLLEYQFYGLLETQWEAPSSSHILLFCQSFSEATYPPCFLVLHLNRFQILPVVFLKHFHWNWIEISMSHKKLKKIVPSNWRSF